MSMLITRMKNGVPEYEYEGKTYTSETYLHSIAHLRHGPYNENRIIVHSLAHSMLDPLTKIDPPALEYICHEMFDGFSGYRAHTIYRILPPGFEIIDMVRTAMLVQEKL